MGGAVGSWLGQSVDVVIEVTRGAHVRRDSDGRLILWTPVPAPFNYGHVPGVPGGDGAPLDAIVLGPPLPVGLTVRRRVIGVVHFVDDGAVDDKLVCASRLTWREVVRVRAFFAVYGPLKRLQAWRRGARGVTATRAVAWASR